MNVLRLDSVVFETPDVARARKFYVDTLGLHVGTFVKDGATVADEDEKYFNLEVGGTLLGFELGQTQAGTIVLMVDDLLATGGTIGACCRLVEALGGEIAGVTFVIELAFLKGRDRIKQYKVHSLLSYDE